MSRLPTLGVFGPRLDEPTGVARYSGLLHDHLALRYNITYVGNDDPDDPTDFDRVLYQLGASRRHHGAYAAMKRRPGPAVLHDPIALDYYNEAWDLIEPDEREAVLDLGSAFVGRPIASHEELAEALDAPPGADRWSADIGVEQIFLPNVTLALVHSTYWVERLARAGTPTQLVRQPVPRLDPVGATMRAELGIGEEDLVVGTFGYLGIYKRIDRIVDAWLGWTDRPEASQLLVVGEPLDPIALPSTPDVRHLRNVDNATFEALLSCVDFGVQLRHPSMGETSAVTATLLGNGRPVVVSATVHTEDLAGPGLRRVAPDEAEVDGLIRAFDDLARLRLQPGPFRSEHAPERCAEPLFSALEADVEQEAPNLPG